MRLMAIFRRTAVITANTDQVPKTARNSDRLFGQIKKFHGFLLYRSLYGVGVMGAPMASDMPVVPPGFCLALVSAVNYEWCS